MQVKETFLERGDRVLVSDVASEFYLTEWVVVGARFNDESDDNPGVWIRCCRKVKNRDYGGTVIEGIFFRESQLYVIERKHV